MNPEARVTCMKVASLFSVVVTSPASVLLISTSALALPAVPDTMSPQLATENDTSATLLIGALGFLVGAAMTQPANSATNAKPRNKPADLLPITKPLHEMIEMYRDEVLHGNLRLTDS